MNADLHGWMNNGRAMWFVRVSRWLTVFAVSVCCAAPKAVWHYSVGGPGDDQYSRVEVGSDGYPVLIVPISVDPDIDEKTGKRTKWRWRSEITKFTPSGRKRWEVKSDGVGSMRVRGLAIDGENNCFVSGSYFGFMMLGEKSLPDSTGRSGFLAKLSAEGAVLWVKQQFADQLAVDAGGNCRFVTTLWPGGSVGGFTHQTEKTMISVAGSVSATGDMQWIKPLFETVITRNEPVLRTMNPCCTRPDGSMVVVGGYPSGAKLLGGEIVSKGQRDAVMVCLSSEGKILWTKQWGAYLDDTAWDVTSDTNGNVFVCGSTEGASGIVADDKRYRPRGRDDMYVAKFGPDGECQWINGAGGVSWDHGEGLAVDKAGFVYLAGMPRSLFNQTAVFGHQTFQPTGHPYGASLSKLNPEGKFLWTKHYLSVGRGVALGPAGRIYLRGCFNGEMETEAGVLKPTPRSWPPSSLAKMRRRPPRSKYDVFLLCLEDTK